MSRFFVLAIFPILVACVNAPRIESPITQVDRPGTNIVSTAELGSAVLDKGRYRLADGVISPSDIVWHNEFGLRITMPAGLMVAQQRDAGYTYYFSNRTTAHDPLLGDVPWGGKAALRISNSSSSDVRGIALPTGLTSEITPPPQITKTQVISFDRNGYRQQLIYGGRVGAILRFQYRSVFGDGSQPPSNQDFEWNLLDGPVVSYRGAKIEILESTNARLSYRVISSFEESTSQP